MNRRVLFVDDEPNVLHAFERQLRRQRLTVDTAVGGEAGLALLATQGPYAVVVSDMRMPGMDGVEVLTRAKDVAPDAVRIMLTGVADQQTAIDAINEGSIFRFLTKPCPANALIRALDAALRQHELVIAERELLEQTLSGAVKVLMDVLSLVNSVAFRSASRLRKIVRELASELPVDDSWQLDLAAMLSQIGCVTLPQAMLQHVYSGGTLPSSEVAMFEAHPGVGASLISHIPRLEAVAEIIAYQDKRFDGSDPPEDGRRGNSIPLGARILKLALDVDALTVEGVEGDALLETIFSRRGWYDPDVVVALGRVFAVVTRFERQTVGLDALAPGMVLAEDVVSEAGVLIIVKGQEVTSALTGRLQNFLTAPRRREQITVLVPVNEDDGESQVA